LFDTEPSLPKLFTLSPSLLERVVGVGEQDGECKSISDVTAAVAGLSLFKLFCCVEMVCCVTRNDVFRVNIPEKMLVG
jgi:hypothetical protein